jgi:hypothetical protein
MGLSRRAQPSCDGRACVGPVMCAPPHAPCTQTRAQRTFHLRSLPPVLLMSLNRFDYDMTTLQRVKLTSRYVCMSIQADGQAPQAGPAAGAGPSLPYRHPFACVTTHETPSLLSPERPACVQVRVPCGAGHGALHGAAAAAPVHLRARRRDRPPGDALPCPATHTMRTHALPLRLPASHLPPSSPAHSTSSLASFHSSTLPRPTATHLPAYLPTYLLPRALRTRGTTTPTSGTA